MVLLGAAEARLASAQVRSCITRMNRPHDYMNQTIPAVTQNVLMTMTMPYGLSLSVTARRSDLLEMSS